MGFSIWKNTWKDTEDRDSSVGGNGEERFLPGKHADFGQSVPDKHCLVDRWLPSLCNSELWNRPTSEKGGNLGLCRPVPEKERLLCRSAESVCHMAFGFSYELSDCQRHSSEKVGSSSPSLSKL